MGKLSLFKRKQAGLGSVAIVLLVLVGLVVVLGLWIMGGYNNLVSQDAEVQRRASNIESDMKRRADLIPNLVATVKGYAKHEKGVYEDISNARSRLLSANVTQDPKGAAQADSAMTHSLGRLLAIAENYPQLKADQNFMSLQDQLEGTENRINTARLEYNDAVTSYNITVRTFPNSIVAGMTGFQRKTPFEATAAEKINPQVQF